MSWTLCKVLRLHDMQKPFLPKSMAQLLIVFLHAVLFSLKVVMIHYVLSLQTLSPRSYLRLWRHFLLSWQTLVLWKLDFPLMIFAIVCDILFTFLVKSCHHYICLAQEMLLNCAQMKLSHLMINSEDICYLPINHRWPPTEKIVREDISTWYSVFYATVRVHFSAKLNLD